MDVINVNINDVNGPKELTKTEAWYVFRVFRQAELFSLIMSFVTYAAAEKRMEYGQIMIALGDAWWVKKNLQSGKIRMTCAPIVTNPLMQRLLDEEYFSADDLLADGSNDALNRLASAIENNFHIYSTLPLMSNAAKYKRAMFINWMAIKNARRLYRPRVVLVK